VNTYLRKTATQSLITEALSSCTLLMILLHEGTANLMALDHPHITTLHSETHHTLTLFSQLHACVLSAFHTSQQTSLTHISLMLSTYITYLTLSYAKYNADSRHRGSQFAIFSIQFRSEIQTVFLNIVWNCFQFCSSLCIRNHCLIWIWIPVF
jgi:Ca2+/Na+ antiporter